MANRIPTPCSCLPHPKSTPSNQTNELAIATGKCLVTIDSLLLLLVWLLNERNSFQTFKIALLHVHCTQPKELLKKKKKMGDKNGNEINVLKCIIVELRFLHHTSHDGRSFLAFANMCFTQFISSLHHPCHSFTHVFIPSVHSRIFTQTDNCKCVRNLNCDAYAGAHTPFPMSSFMPFC